MCFESIQAKVIENRNQPCLAAILKRIPEKWIKGDSLGFIYYYKIGYCETKSWRCFQTP